MKSEEYSDNPDLNIPSLNYKNNFSVANKINERKKGCKYFKITKILYSIFQISRNQLAKKSGIRLREFLSILLIPIHKIS